MQTSLMRVALGAAVTVVAAFGLRPFLWPSRPATAQEQAAAIAPAQSKPAPAQLPTAPAQAKPTPTNAAVVKASANEASGSAPAVVHPETLAGEPTAAATPVMAIVEDDDDPGFSFAEGKGENRPRPQPVPLEKLDAPEKRPGPAAVKDLVEHQERSAPATSSEARIRPLPKESALQLQPIPGAPAAATREARPSVAEAAQPAAEKVPEKPAPPKAVEQSAPQVVVETPALQPAPEKSKSVATVALVNPYQSIFPTDRTVATPRAIRTPAALRSPAAAQPVPQTNAKVRPTVIPADVADAARPAAAKVSAVATPQLVVPPPMGSPAALREQLSQPASVGGARQENRTSTPAVGGPAEAEPAGTLLRNPFEGGIPNDQPLRQNLPRITSVHRPAAEKLAARTQSAVSVADPAQVGAAAAQRRTPDSDVRPASHESHGASEPVQRAAYWMGYADAPGGQAPAAHPDMLPNVPGTPPGVPAPGLTPEWPQPKPGTFFNKPDSRAAGTPAATGGISAGMPAGEGPMTICEGTQILARVGSDVILLSDVASMVNELFAANQDKLPPDANDLEKLRQHMIKQMLQSRIETKLAYLDVRRTYPKEAVEKQEKHIVDIFDGDEITRLMTQMKFNSRDELDVYLRAKGSSLEKARRAFLEKTIAQIRIRDQVKPDAEVGPEEMRSYYHKHIKEFEKPAQACWEEIEVRFAKHGSHEEAAQVIAELGNLVLRGTAFAEVARARSEGISAATGGKREWISQGSLASEQLDQALFSLPVGTMSQIIEDKTGYRIVRVLERKPVERQPFLDAQVEIRKKIRDQRRENDLRQYLAKLRKEIPVWTVFDSLAENTPPMQR